MLFLVSTPIGNLGDISTRNKEILEKVDLILCEDTRRTKRLLFHLNIKNKVESFNDFNKEKKTPSVIVMLLKNLDVALVSDAGTPSISDPGFYLVRECIKKGIKVTHIPGASAVISALILSGFPTDKFTFIGFLPKKKGKLTKTILSFDATTYIAFDSPYRIRKTLETIQEISPNLKIAVCRELTKLHEEILRGTAKEILETLQKNVKGEITLVFSKKL